MKRTLTFLFFAAISSLNLICLERSVSVLMHDPGMANFLWSAMMALLSYEMMKDLLIREFLYWDEDDEGDEEGDEEDDEVDGEAEEEEEP